MFQYLHNFTQLIQVQIEKFLGNSLGWKLFVDIWATCLHRGLFDRFTYKLRSGWENTKLFVARTLHSGTYGHRRWKQIWSRQKSNNFGKW